MTGKAIVAVMMCVALALSSCGSVFDDLDPCPGGVRMRFVYDYNLESANAFPAQVDCLTLHIYDGDGNFVTTVTETTDVLADENWRMTIDLAPGHYRAIAYGGIACSDASFVHTAEPAQGSHYSAIAMQLAPEKVGTRLHDHFHGAVDFDIDPNALDYTEETLHMSKTTNHIRILLQQLNGDPVDGRDFEFYITDDNTVLDHANMPVAGHATTYPAWQTGFLSTATDPENRADGALQDVQVGFGDLSTSRLHFDTGARLRIFSKEQQRNVAELPLNSYLAMCNNYDYSDQEFLDRCSHYTLAFFLDESDHWVRMEIRVLGYTVRINNIEM